MTFDELRTEIRSAAGINHSPEESIAIAKVYLEDKFGIKRTNSNGEVPINRIDEITKDLNLLSQGVPVQYVTGVQWFGGQIYKVNPNVLIPRPETEELVCLIADQIKLMDRPLSLLDIGTGSGCIPISLKLKFPDISAFATDISGGALKVARFNAQNLNADVTFVEDDILNPKYIPLQKLDLFISNPPYIPYSESGKLDNHVVSHEPHTALFVPDLDPLIFYTAVINYSLKHLISGGYLYFEIHQDFGIEVVNLPQMSNFTNVQLIKDVSGNERFVTAVLV